MSLFSRWPAGWLMGALLWMGCLALAGAQTVLPLPPLSGRVIDQTGTLDSAAQAALTAKLAELEQTRGTQVVLLLVPTTAPEDIADYTQRLGDAWKIGRREVGDGVLFVVAKNDRRLRIAPAKTLEGALPDLLAKRIIDEVVTPAFRKGDYAGGLNAGIDRLSAVIAGEALPAPDATGDASANLGLGLEDWLLLLFFGGPMAAAALRRVFGAPMGAMLAGLGAGALAWWLSQALWLAAAAGMVAAVATLFLQLLPSLPSSGAGRGRSGGWHGPSGGIGGGGWGGGGSSGGGGFSSGGGGDFGGGGASGSW
jgi:uncharacterized protein